MELYYAGMEKYSLSQRCRERNAKISRITIHCGGPFTLEGIVRWMEDMCQYISYNYIIDRDGRVMLQIPPNYAAWSTGSSQNDRTAINILCATDSNTDEMPECTWNELVDLCVRVCKNNRYKKLLWRTDGNYRNTPSDTMIITLHHLVNPAYKSSPCVPEPVINRLGELASKVTEEVNGNN